jgi:hypothetical protein
MNVEWQLRFEAESFGDELIWREPTKNHPRTAFDPINRL